MKKQLQSLKLNVLTFCLEDGIFRYEMRKKKGKKKTIKLFRENKLNKGHI